MTELPLHPADYWNSYDTEGKYANSIEIIRLLYDNIDKLYKTEYSNGSNQLNAITPDELEPLVKLKGILTHYNQTGIADSKKANYLLEFTQMLQQEGLGDKTYRMREISNAEHYILMALLICSPIPDLGVLYGTTAWEEWSGLLSTNHKPDLKQLTGPDLAGYCYGEELKLLLVAYGLDSWLIKPAY